MKNVNSGHLQVIIIASFNAFPMKEDLLNYFYNTSICWNKTVNRDINIPYTTHT